MTFARIALAASGAALLLSGCVAAAVPAIAGAGIVKARQDRHKAKAVKPKRGQTAPRPGDTFTTADGQTLRVLGLSELPPPSGKLPVAEAKVPPEMQYLYGSGEAAALSLQAYRALWTYLHTEIGYLRDKTKARSVILSPGSTLAAPLFDPCGKRPLAVVFDIDETVLLNLGFEGDAAQRGNGYDAARWTRWEQSGAAQVRPVPGAAETVAAIRGEGITVIFNSNRATSTAAQTAAALDGAGLGPVTIGETLITRDEGTPSGKDARRWKIAERYCVVAMAGDQLGDFSDLFNAPDLSVRARRNTAGETMLSQLWGAGWFMLPNPVYGTALKGGMDDIFPPETRWTDPQEKK